MVDIYMHFKILGTAFLLAMRVYHILDLHFQIPQSKIKEQILVDLLFYFGGEGGI